MTSAKNHSLRPAGSAATNVPSFTLALQASTSSEETAYSGMCSAEQSPLARAAAERRLVNPPGPAPQMTVDNSRGDIEACARHAATAGASASVRTPVAGSREVNDSSAVSAPSHATATDPDSVDVSRIRTLPSIIRRAVVGNPACPVRSPARSADVRLEADHLRALAIRRSRAHWN